MVVLLGYVSRLLAPFARVPTSSFNLFHPLCQSQQYKWNRRGNLLWLIEIFSPFLVSHPFAHPFLEQKAKIKGITFGRSQTTASLATAIRATLVLLCAYNQEQSGMRR